VLESTIGASKLPVMLLTKSWPLLVIPPLPEPIVLSTACSAPVRAALPLRAPPTKILFVVESKTGEVSAVVLTTAGQTLAPDETTSAGVPLNTPVNLGSVPSSAPTKRMSLP
jgi:hypothetical protein